MLAHIAFHHVKNRSKIASRNLNGCHLEYTFSFIMRHTIDLDSNNLSRERKAATGIVLSRFVMQD